MPKTAKQHAEELQEVWDNADREGRDLTPGERAHVEQLIESAKSMHRIEQQMKEIGGGLSFTKMTDPNHSFAGGGPGDVFVKSAAYQKIMDPSHRGQTWTTGPVEVSSMQLVKGTMLETGVGGPGGGLVAPQYEPGIVSRLFEPLGVRDVFGQSQTTASQVRYVNEGTATSAAAGVAEGGTKPESTIAMSEVVEPIKKIATVLPVSDELLEDAPCQPVHEAGRGRQRNRAGAGAGEHRRVELPPADTIIMHPTNWLNTRLLRDGLGGTAGNFLGGGPFTGAYGTDGATGIFGQSLWNTRVVLSTVVGAGTALVGNFGQAAHIWRKGGVSVEASNSHDTFFIKNLNMLRAEERLGLGVYRPPAFTAVSGLA